METPEHQAFYKVVMKKILEGNLSKTQEDELFAQLRELESVKSKTKTPDEPAFSRVLDRRMSPPTYLPRNISPPRGYDPYPGRGISPPRGGRDMPPRGLSPDRRVGGRVYSQERHSLSRGYSPERGLPPRRFSPDRRMLEGDYAPERLPTRRGYSPDRNLQSRDYIPDRGLSSERHGQELDRRVPPRGDPSSRDYNPGRIIPPRGQSPDRMIPPRRYSPDRRYPTRGPSPDRFPPRGPSPDRRFPPRGASPDRFPTRGPSPDRRFPPRGPSPDRRFPPRGPSPDRRFPPRIPSPERRFPPRVPSPDRMVHPDRLPPRDYNQDRIIPPHGSSSDRRFPPRGPSPDRMMPPDKMVPPDRLPPRGPSPDRMMPYRDRSPNRIMHPRGSSSERFQQQPQRSGRMSPERNFPPRDINSKRQYPPNEMSTDGAPYGRDRYPQGDDRIPQDRMIPPDRDQPYPSMNQNVRRMPQISNDMHRGERPPRLTDSEFTRKRPFNDQGPYPPNDPIPPKRSSDEFTPFSQRSNRFASLFKEDDFELPPARGILKRSDPEPGGYRDNERRPPGSMFQHPSDNRSPRFSEFRDSQMHRDTRDQMNEPPNNRMFQSGNDRPAPFISPDQSSNRGRNGGSMEEGWNQHRARDDGIRPRDNQSSAQGHGLIDSEVQKPPQPSAEEIDRRYKEDRQSTLNAPGVNDLDVHPKPFEAVGKDHRIEAHNSPHDDRIIPRLGILKQPVHRIEDRSESRLSIDLGVQKRQGLMDLDVQKPQGLMDLGVQKPQGLMDLGVEKTRVLMDLGVQKPQGLMDLGVEKPRFLMDLGVQKPQGLMDLGVQKPQALLDLGEQKPQGLMDLGSQKPQGLIDLAVQKPQGLMDLGVQKPQGVMDLGVQKLQGAMNLDVQKPTNPSAEEIARKYSEDKRIAGIKEKEGVSSPKDPNKKPSAEEIANKYLKDRSPSDMKTPVDKLHASSDINNTNVNVVSIKTQDVADTVEKKEESPVNSCKIVLHKNKEITSVAPLMSKPVNVRDEKKTEMFAFPVRDRIPTGLQGGLLQNLKLKEENLRLKEETAGKYIKHAQGLLDLDVHLKQLETVGKGHRIEPHNSPPAVISIPGFGSPEEYDRIPTGLQGGLLQNLKLKEENLKLKKETAGKYMKNAQGKGHRIEAQNSPPAVISIPGFGSPEEYVHLIEDVKESCPPMERRKDDKSRDSNIPERPNESRERGSNDPLEFKDIHSDYPRASHRMEIDSKGRDSIIPGRPMEGIRDIPSPRGSSVLLDERRARESASPIDKNLDHPHVPQRPMEERRGLPSKVDFRNPDGRGGDFHRDHLSHRQDHQIDIPRDERNLRPEFDQRNRHGPMSMNDREFRREQDQRDFINYGRQSDLNRVDDKGDINMFINPERRLEPDLEMRDIFGNSQGTNPPQLNNPEKPYDWRNLAIDPNQRPLSRDLREAPAEMMQQRSDNPTGPRDFHEGNNQSMRPMEMVPEHLEFQERSMSQGFDPGSRDSHTPVFNPGMRDNPDPQQEKDWLVDVDRIFEKGSEQQETPENKHSQNNSVDLLMKLNSILSAQNMKAMGQNVNKNRHGGPTRHGGSSGGPGNQNPQGGPVNLNHPGASGNTNQPVRIGNPNQPVGMENPNQPVRMGNPNQPVKMGNPNRQNVPRPPRGQQRKIGEIYLDKVPKWMMGIRHNFEYLPPQVPLGIFMKKRGAEWLDIFIDGKSYGKLFYSSNSNCTLLVEKLIFSLTKDKTKLTVSGNNIDLQEVFTIGEKAKSVKIGNTDFLINVRGPKKKFWIDKEVFEIFTNSAPDKIQYNHRTYHTVAINTITDEMTFDKHVIKLDKTAQITVGRGDIVKVHFEQPSVFREIVINNSAYQLDVRPPLPVLYIEGLPHGICFAKTIVELWIDSQMYILSCDRIHSIELKKIYKVTKERTVNFGIIGPGHELLINNETHEMAFGGEYKTIQIHNKLFRIKLGSHVPEFKILDPLPYNRDTGEITFIPDVYMRELMENDDFRKERQDAFDENCIQTDSIKDLDDGGAGQGGSSSTWEPCQPHPKPFMQEPTRMVIPEQPSFEVMKAMDYIKNVGQMQMQQQMMQQQQYAQMMQAAQAQDMMRMRMQQQSMQVMNVAGQQMMEPHQLMNAARQPMMDPHLQPQGIQVINSAEQHHQQQHQPQRGFEHMPQPEQGSGSSTGLPNIDVNDLFSKLQQTGVLDSIQALTKGKGPNN